MPKRLLARMPLTTRLCRSALGLALGLALAATAARAQTPPLEYGFSLQAAAAAEGRLPFWLHADRRGVFDLAGGNALARLHVRRPFDPDRKLAFAFEADVLARASERSTAYVHQLYGSLRYGAFRLTAGRKAETAGLVDPSLSLGSMTLSPNAAPLPGISLAFDYIPIIVLPGKTELIHAKGFFGHAWLDGDRFVKGAFVHEKYLYLRGIGPDDFPVHAYAGVSHFVVWGGEHPRLGKLPSDFRAFLDVVLARAGEPGDAPKGEVVNALGNTVATYDFGLSVNLPAFRVMAYRQFFIETSPAARFRNPWDGLWGVSVRFKKAGVLRGLLWEHVNTKRQGSRHDRNEPDGADSYYNNFLYKSGWVYHGRALGLPLIFGDGVRRGVINNLLVAHHVGAEGVVAGRFAFKTLLTYSRNYGARDDCNDDGCSGNPTLLTPRRDQYSFLFEIGGPLSPRLGFTAALALDVGALYPDNAGLMLGLSWTNRTRE